MLIVEDDPSLRRSLELLLKLEGYAPVLCADGESALAEVDRAAFDVVLLDLNTAGICAQEFVERLRGGCAARGLGVPRLGIMSGSLCIANEAQQLRADFTLPKPFDLARLLEQLNPSAFAPDPRARPDTCGASPG